MALNANIFSCKKLGKIFEALTKHEYNLLDFTRNVYHTQDLEYVYEDIFKVSI